MASHEKIKVLFLDDELHNVASFRAEFRMDYQVFSTTSIEEAEQLLENNPGIHIVLCDQRMPVKNGVEFFRDIQQKFPAPVRILVTAYTDIESVIDAINRGGVFRYIKKPWDPFEVKAALEEGYQHYITNSLLKENNAELQAAYTELDKFAHNITHDIRGPISSAMGAIDILIDSDNLEEVREIAGMMKGSLQKLDNYITDLNDYYRLNRGSQQISVIDFESIVSDMERIFSMEGLLQQVKFTSEINQKEEFICDEISIRIILSNLFSNAFKYQRKDNPDKRVDLSIHVHDHKATIEVNDNGIGIEAAYKMHIFDLFYRANVEAPGSGFGLYNVQTALQKLGGTIDVNSELGKGSSFTLIIPGK